MGSTDDRFPITIHRLSSFSAPTFLFVGVEDEQERGCGCQSVWTFHAADLLLTQNETTLNHDAVGFHPPECAAFKQTGAADFARQERLPDFAFAMRCAAEDALFLDYTTDGARFTPPQAINDMVGADVADEFVTGFPEQKDRCGHAYSGWEASRRLGVPGSPHLRKFLGAGRVEHRHGPPAIVESARGQGED